MAIFRPLRLKRTLSPITGTQWSFSMTAGSFAEADDTIQSVVINRGVGGRNVGHNPTTCEIRVDGRKDGFITGNQMRMFLREDPANRLGDHLGAVGADIAMRFKGRLGRVGIDDTGKRFDSELSGSSFLTQMNYSPAGFVPTAQESLGAILLDMTKANEPVRGIDFGTFVGPVNISNYALGETTRYREGVGTYAGDIGVLMQERRDGSTRAWSHFTRYDLAATRLLTEWPLMRSQAIAPGHYEQSNDRPAKRVEYTIRNEVGGLATRVAEVANPTGELRETESIDWSKWQVSTVDNQLYREAYARVFESSARLYSLPTVTIDLLMLLKHSGEYSKRIARQMLLLEVGEPVFLSGDWPPVLQGVHFADGIKETIGPNEWTLELSLIPHAVAVGRVSPDVPARAWDSATKAWDEESREWDNA